MGTRRAVDVLYTGESGDVASSVGIKGTRQEHLSAGGVESLKREGVLTVEYRLVSGAAGGAGADDGETVRV